MVKKKSSVAFKCHQPHTVAIYGSQEVSRGLPNILANIGVYLQLK